MAKHKPLTWTAKVVRGDEVIPYESLTEKEKDELGIRLTRRSIEVVERMNGREIEWIEPPPDTVTA